MKEKNYMNSEKLCIFWNFCSQYSKNSKIVVYFLELLHTRTCAVDPRLIFVLQKLTANHNVTNKKVKTATTRRNMNGLASYLSAVLRTYMYADKAHDINEKN